MSMIQHDPAIANITSANRQPRNCSQTMGVRLNSVGPTQPTHRAHRTNHIWSLITARSGSNKRELGHTVPHVRLMMGSCFFEKNTLR